MNSSKVMRWSSAVGLVSWELGIVLWLVLDPDAESIGSLRNVVLLAGGPLPVFVWAWLRPGWVPGLVATVLSFVLAAALGGGYNVLAYPELAAMVGLGAATAGALAESWSARQRG